MGGEGAGPAHRLREETRQAARQGQAEVRRRRRGRRAGDRGGGRRGLRLREGRGEDHPGGREPAKAGLLGSPPTLSFQLLSIIRSQGAALTAINKAFMLQKEAEIISSRLPALPGQQALALSSLAAWGPTQDKPGKGPDRGQEDPPPLPRGVLSECFRPGSGCGGVVGDGRCRGF